MKRSSFMFATLSISLVVSLTLPYVVIPVSGSIHPSLLIKLPSIRPVKGDYVTFPLEIDRFKDRHLILTKKIGCMSGEKLESRGGAYFCNGDYLGTALDKDGNGNPLSRFEFNGIIPNNKAFLIGDNPNSYDSRYWGFSSVKNAIYSLPIF